MSLQGKNFRFIERHWNCRCGALRVMSGLSRGLLVSFTELREDPRAAAPVLSKPADIISPLLDAVELPSTNMLSILLWRSALCCGVTC